MPCDLSPPLLAVLLLAACGGGKYDSADPVVLEYTSDWTGVARMLEDHCVDCHGRDGSAEYLPLPEALTLDVASGAGALVVAGDPEGSKLWRVISGALAAGDPGVMPLGEPLAFEEIGHVRAWIVDGASLDGVEDADGDGVSAEDGDCDDGDPLRYGGAPEVCDGVHNDCDDEVDEPDALGARSWYPDEDGDGFGADAGAVVQCEAPAGFVAEGGDCDDGSGLAWPGAPETDCADPVDYNCDGSAGLDDADGDGFPACEDCDDGAAAVNPGAASDPWDGVDDDCDGTVDEDATPVSHAADIQPIWRGTCTGTCHAEPTPSGELDLQSAYAHLVDVPSVALPTMDLVQPGDVENSFLWHKINGTQGTLGVLDAGADMPPMGSLSPAERSLIEQWIALGAQP